MREIRIKINTPKQRLLTQQTQLEKCQEDTISKIRPKNRGNVRNDAYETAISKETRLELKKLSALMKSPHINLAIPINIVNHNTGNFFNDKRILINPYLKEIIKVSQQCFNKKYRLKLPRFYEFQDW